MEAEDQNKSNTPMNKILGLLFVAISSVSSPAVLASPQSTVMTLKDYALMGQEYHPVGNWVGPRTLEISFNATDPSGQRADPASLHYSVQGDVITLYFKDVPALSITGSSKQKCDTYATFRYRVTDLAPGDYKVGIVGDRTYAPVPLPTIQQAQAAAVPAVMDMTIEKGSTILLNGKPIDLDGLDLLFTKAEPYKPVVHIDSNSTYALRVWSLADLHQLPYSFPNLDALLERPYEPLVATASKSAPKTWTPFGIKSRLPLTVTLRVQAAEVDQGSKPGFVIEVRNAGTVPIRVLDIKKANSMFLSLNLTRDGKPVRDIPVFIDDPGPVGPDETLLLAPGQAMHREEDGFPFALDRLPPGPYRAEITYYLDGMKTDRYIESNSVMFSVVP